MVPKYFLVFPLLSLSTGLQTRMLSFPFGLKSTHQYNIWGLPLNWINLCGKCLTKEFVLIFEGSKHLHCKRTYRNSSEILHRNTEKKKLRPLGADLWRQDLWGLKPTQGVPEAVTPSQAALPTVPQSKNDTLHFYF